MKTPTTPEILQSIAQAPTKHSPTGVSVVLPRQDVDTGDWCPNIFLAGTIDMGNSDNWQQKTISKLISERVDVNVYNPRRVCFAGDKAEIDYQIRWELNNIQMSNIVFFNFLPDSQSPVTLMELGLVLAGQEETGNLPIVVCPDEFWRAQNVWVTCAYYGITPFTSYAAGFDRLIFEIEKENRKIQQSRRYRRFHGEPEL